MSVPFSHVILLGILLFLVGAWCTAARRELIMVLVGVEVMLNAAAIVFVAAALRWQRVDGQVFALFVIAVAAAEAAVNAAPTAFACYEVFRERLGVDRRELGKAARAAQRFGASTRRANRRCCP